MNIFCNGESRALPDSSTLQNLLQDLGCARAGVAVAVNDAIVPMARWNAVELHENDRILVIQAAQGG